MFTRGQNINPKWSNSTPRVHQTEGGSLWLRRQALFLSRPSRWYLRPITREIGGRLWSEKDFNSEEILAKPLYETEPKRLVCLVFVVSLNWQWASLTPRHAGNSALLYWWYSYSSKIRRREPFLNRSPATDNIAALSRLRVSQPKPLSIYCDYRATGSTNSRAQSMARPPGWHPQPHPHPSNRRSDIPQPVSEFKLHKQNPASRLRVT